MTTSKPTRKRVQKLVEAEGVPRTIRGEVNPEAAQAAPRSVPASTDRRLDLSSQRNHLFTRTKAGLPPAMMMVSTSAQAAAPMNVCE